MTNPTKGSSRAAFGDMAQNVTDRVDDPSEAGVEFYVGLEHLDSDSLKIRRWGAPTDVEATKLRFRRGDIIFGKRRVYQRKLAVADFDGICSAHAMVIRARPQVADPGFLPFFMQSDVFMERALEISVGSLSPTINWKTLAAQEFRVPPLDEQRALAHICRSAVDLEESMKKLVRACERVGGAWIDELLTGDNSVLTPLGDLISDIEAGKSLLGGTTPPKEGQFGVLKVGAVVPGGLRPEESKVLLNQEEFNHELSIREGDLLITRANTSDLVGLCCVSDADFSNLMLSDKTLRLHPKPGVSRAILLHALRSGSVRRQIKSIATGTGAAMKNLSQSKIASLLVRYPRDQHSAAVIEDVLSSAASSVNETGRRLSSASRLRRSIVNQVSSEVSH